MATITINTLHRKKANGEKFAVVTAYDSTQAQLAEKAGIEVLLVGDSLGNVVQGQKSTVPVDMEDMAYHTLCVANGSQSSFIIGDLPFMSYATPESAMENSAILMQAGAHCVKLEGGAWLEETIEALTTRGIPVCGHLGLLPQSVNKAGGYRVQARDRTSADRLLDDAKAIQDAGADLLVLEMVPSNLAGEVSKSLDIPVIGIGAGNQTDAQVLVFYDMLGATGKVPSFVKNFLKQPIDEALKDYAEQVRSGAFPDQDHTPA